MMIGLVTEGEGEEGGGGGGGKSHCKVGTRWVRKRYFQRTTGDHPSNFS